MIAAIVGSCAIGGCQQAENPPAAAPQNTAEAKTPVSLMLNWFPEVEHGGYYAALEHGYYDQVGLDVTILPGGPESPVVQQVAREAADFGVINADKLLFGRAAGAPAVALVAPLQISPRCLIVHKKSGIRDLQGLKNLTIAMSDSDAFSFFLRKRLPLEGVRVVPYTGNVAQFLLHPDYAQQGYVFSEPYVAQKQGGDPQVLMLSDLGYNPYTSLLFATEKRIKKQPEVVRKMVAASLRGWTKYLTDPEPTNRRIHELNPEMDLDSLAYGVQAMRPLVWGASNERKGIGQMTLERWQTLADQLIECEQLEPGKVDVRKAFTTQFLPESSP